MRWGGGSDSTDSPCSRWPCPALYLVVGWDPWNWAAAAGSQELLPEAERDTRATLSGWGLERDAPAWPSPPPPSWGLTWTLTCRLVLEARAPEAAGSGTGSIAQPCSLHGSLLPEPGLILALPQPHASQQQHTPYTHLPNPGPSSLSHTPSFLHLWRCNSPYPLP